MGEFATKGVAGTALGFGIGGTALALMNNGGNCGGGLLGGLLGGNRNGQCEPMETKEASCLRQQVAALTAEKYADQVGIEVYKASAALDSKQNENLKVALQAIADLRVQVAVNDEREKCQQGQIDRIANVTEKLATEVCLSKAELATMKADLRLESERRACGDDRIVAWTSGNFIQGRLVLPSTPTITGFNNGCCNQTGPFNGHGDCDCNS